MLILFALAVATAAPSAEAEALGVRLARTSGLVTLAPMMIQKDMADLAKENPSLSPAELDQLMRIGREEQDRAVAKLIATLGSTYAQRLSIADLRLLVAQNESAEAARRRTAEPGVMMEVMAGMGVIDPKRATVARMCAETGKLCAPR